jgi:N-acetylneuraminic acid mutarotase
MFSGTFAVDTMEDGSVFLDRDGDLFAYVLDYLRSGVVSAADPGVQVDLALLYRLKREFDYFGINLEQEQPEVAFVFGGIASDYVMSSERFNFRDGQWNKYYQLDDPRLLFGVCEVAGNLYFTGGNSRGHILKQTTKLNIDTHSCCKVAPMQRKSYEHGTCTIDNFLFVIGGRDAQGVIQDAWKYDTSSNEWHSVQALPAARCLFGICVIGSTIYVIGGYDNSSKPCDTMFMYDSTTNVWTTMATLPKPRYSCFACAINGAVYVAGGYDGSRKMDSVVKYDLLLDKWNEVAPMPTRRMSMNGFVLDKCMFVVGGLGSGDTTLDVVEKYDPRTNKWSFPAPLNDKRRKFAACVVKPPPIDLFDSLIAARQKAASSI